MTHYINDKRVNEMTFYPSLVADAKVAGMGLDEVSRVLGEQMEIVVNNKKYKLEENND